MCLFICIAFTTTRVLYMDMYTGFGDRINAKMLNFTKPYRVDWHTYTQLLGAMRTMFDIGLNEAKAKAAAVVANGRTMVPFSYVAYRRFVSHRSPNGMDGEGGRGAHKSHLYLFDCHWCLFNPMSKWIKFQKSALVHTYS